MNSELTPDNKIVNGLWISPDGKPLSNLERLCIYSFCANGHDFHLWTYGDLPNIPRDTSPGKVEVRDANEILPARKMFFVKKSLAGFCDWFRWELMARFGGWYVDMDMVCLRPLAFEELIVFGSESDYKVNSAFMKFPQGIEFPHLMANACANPGRIVPWDNAARRWNKRARRLWFWKSAHEKQSWGESGGPKGFTLAAKHHGLFAIAKPVYMTDFLSWNVADNLTDGDLHEAGILSPVLQSAYTLHFGNTWWKDSRADKNGTFHPNSPFEILKQRYLPELQK